LFTFNTIHYVPCVGRCLYTPTYAHTSSVNITAKYKQIRINEFKKKMSKLRGYAVV